MNEAKNAVLTLALCAVCGLLFHFLLPESGVSRTAKTLISLVMLCAVCAPLFGVWEHLRGVGSDSRVFGSFGERDTTFPVDLYERQAEAAVGEALDAIVKRYTNVPRRIEVDAHIPEGGGIRIDRVRITFEALPEGRDSIEAEITAECGVIPEIRVERTDE